MILGSLAECCGKGCGNCTCGGDTSGYPNFGSDHNMETMDWGEDPSTNDTNHPAIAAAKTAGGSAYPFTINNGINKKSPNNYNYKEINPKFHFDDEGGNERDAFRLNDDNGF